jgi:hypothetical protein
MVSGPLTVDDLLHGAAMPLPHDVPAPECSRPVFMTAQAGGY